VDSVFVPFFKNINHRTLSNSLWLSISHKSSQGPNLLSMIGILWTVIGWTKIC